MYHIRLLVRFRVQAGRCAVQRRRDTANPEHWAWLDGINQVGIVAFERTSVFNGNAACRAELEDESRHDRRPAELLGAPGGASW